MKHSPALLTLVAASALAQTAPTPAPAKSAWTQTHNLALATDYIFRGTTQIDGDGIALSGGSDVTHDSGFSAGVWAANQSWTDSLGASVGSGLEVDVYAGYAKTLGEVTLSAGLISYHYEGAEIANTTEGYAAVAAFGASVKFSHSLTDYFGATNSDETGYVDLSYSREIPGIKDLTLALHYGITDGEGLQESYNDFRVALTYPVAGYSASVAYSDVDGYGSSTQKDALVLSLSKTF